MTTLRFYCRNTFLLPVHKQILGAGMALEEDDEDGAKTEKDDENGELIEEEDAVSASSI